MNALIGVGLLVAGLIIGILIAFLIQLRRKNIQISRVAELTDYLEAASLGQAKVITFTEEDELSKLQDEICKTVTSLHRLQQQALEEKEAYAQNLANIAHQIKTPLTSLYVISQQIPNSHEQEHEQIAQSIQKQLDRMSMLQNNLILMARIDSGTLRVNKSAQDVFTLLTIVADGVEDIAEKAHVEIDIVNDAPAEIVVDEHWTSEALSNIVKNCIEHSPSGSVVTLTYNTNPLYTEIHITDTGNGFDKDELTHLFERFYVGHSHSSESTGIGLSFARELLELQDATIQISNNPEGGACFNIRFYRH